MRLEKLLLVFMISVFLAGCQIYKETETFVPSEEIMIEKGASGLANLNSLNDKVVLEVKGLPVLDDTNTYEAWLVDNDIGLKISIGTFNVDDNGYHILESSAVKEDILDTDSVIVTLEPAPDTDSGPSDKIVLKGDIGGTADIMSVKLDPVEEKIEVELPEVEIEIPEVTTTTVQETVTIVEETTTTVEEEKEKEAAVVIVTKETEKVSLKTTANDPDADKLAIAYSSPLDENGEWQTNYGDAGEYTVTVTASDGKLSTSKDVLIIVNKKEEAPVIDEFSPAEDELATDENTQLDFSASASDINKDELTYSWKLDDNEVSTAKTAKYDVTYDDAGTHTMMLEVTDGASTVDREWGITVNNINRQPVLEIISDITVKETETVNIEPKASDPDGDSLDYTISEPVGDDGEWTTTYDDAGEYKVLVTVSDGVGSDSQEVRITVENVNRPPVIGEIVNK